MLVFAALESTCCVVLRALLEDLDLIEDIAFAAPPITTPTISKDSIGYIIVNFFVSAIFICPYIIGKKPDKRNFQKPGPTEDTGGNRPGPAEREGPSPRTVPTPAV